MYISSFYYRSLYSHFSISLCIVALKSEKFLGQCHKFCLKSKAKINFRSYPEFSYCTFFSNFRALCSKETSSHRSTHWITNCIERKIFVIKVSSFYNFLKQKCTKMPKFIFYWHLVIHRTINVVNAYTQSLKYIEVYYT